MADFEQAFKSTNQNEGGYAFNPADKGGETYMGIARKFWPNWKGWVLIDGIKRQFGTSAKAINQNAGSNQVIQGLVKEFYKSNFWYPLNLSAVNDQQLANNVYDFGVNAGIGTAAKRLQRGAKVTDDGIIGNGTIKAINSLPAKQVYDSFNSLRKSYYDNIIANNPSQSQFRKSWYSRIIPYQV